MSAETERKVTRLWEVPGEKRFVLYSELGRELVYPVGFKDRSLKVGVIIDNEDVERLRVAVREFESERGERKAERRAKRAAERPTSGTISELRPSRQVGADDDVSPKDRVFGRSRSAPVTFVYLDGAYAFAVSPDLAEAAGLHEGMVLDEAEVTRLSRSQDVLKIAESIDRLLAFRPRTAAEVRQRLAVKNYEPVKLEQAIDSRRGYGIMEDAEFATWMIENRATAKGKTPIALRGELRRLGVGDDALRSAEEDAAGRRGEALQTAVHKLARRLDPADERSRKRFVDGLLRRGFNYGDAKAALERLSVVDEELDAAAADE